MSANTTLLSLVTVLSSGNPSPCNEVRNPLWAWLPSLPGNTDPVGTFVFTGPSIKRPCPALSTRLVCSTSSLSSMSITAPFGDLKGTYLSGALLACNRNSLGLSAPGGAIQGWSGEGDILILPAGSGLSKFLPIGEKLEGFPSQVPTTIGKSLTPASNITKTVVPTGGIILDPKSCPPPNGADIYAQGNPSVGSCSGNPCIEGILTLTLPTCNGSLIYST